MWKTVQEVTCNRKGARWDKRWRNSSNVASADGKKKIATTELPTPGATVKIASNSTLLSV